MKSPLAILLFAGLTSAASAAVYTQTFDFPDGTTNLGDGSQMNGSTMIVGNQLRLTEIGAPSGTSSFNIPALAGSSAGWTATFNFTIIDATGGNPPADGFSFNYGNFGLGELGSAEEGMATAGGVTENISFEVDTWMNFDAEQGVNIAEKVGGVDTNLVFTNGPILADGATVSGTVLIDWDPANGATFVTTGLNTNAFFTGVSTSFDAQNVFNFGLSARVGGANETLLIDNLVITTPEPSSILLLGLGSLGLLLRRRR